MADDLDDVAPVAGWCPPGGCPGWTPERVAHAVALAYERGKADMLRGLAELEVGWRPVARKTFKRQVAERLADMTARVPPTTLRFDDPDWPPVAVPGAPGVCIGPQQIRTAAA